PGHYGLPWSNLYVFFNTGVIPSWNHSQYSGIPQTVESSKILVTPSGRVHVIRGNGYTCGLGERGKEKWGGGINRSCHRYQPSNCQIDFFPESNFGSFFHFLRYPRLIDFPSALDSRATAYIRTFIYFLGI